MESGGPTTGRISNGRSQRNLGKPQESRKNAENHCKGLESISESPVLTMQDVGAAAELPPGAGNGYLQPSSGASTLNEGHEPHSFWDVDRISKYWIHRIFNWLGASILSKQKQLSFRPLPAVGSQDDDGSEESESSRDCENEKVREVSKPDRKMSGSWRLLQQRLSDLCHSSFGMGRPGYTGKQHLQPQYEKSPPAEPKEEVDTQNESYVTNTNISGDGGALGGPSVSTITHPRAGMQDPSREILRQPYKPFPRNRAKVQHGLPKPGNVTANGMLMRYPKRTFSPAHLKKAVPVRVERQPSFALVDKYRCPSSERKPTGSNQAQTTFFQAAKSGGPHQPEAVHSQNTEHSSDSGVLGDVDSDENRELLEKRLRSIRRRRSEQQDRHPTVFTYPETSSSVYSSSEASKSRQSSLVS